MIIFALLVHIVLILAMMVAVICFEKDCKKIIFWNLIIVATSIIGFAVYFICFCDKPNIKKSIKTKFEQDEIYKNLIKFSMTKTSSSNETLNFNKMHYSADIFTYSGVQVIDKHEDFLAGVIDDIDNAREYVIIDSEVFLHGLNNESVVALLKEKQSMGIDVKCIYGKRKFVDGKIIKDLRASGVKVCRFNKNDKLNKHYKNTKNIISVDGKIAYLYSACKLKNTEKPVSCSNLCFKLKGEVVKSLDLDCHLDVHFATQKYHEVPTKHYLPSGDIETQYVSSVADKDFEGLLLKAINDAKKQIIIHSNKFIPTPAIKQALLMAILSGIDVRIMLPKATNGASYYTSRAYVKEMAMYGATAYIYDGVICSNFMIIDDLTFVGNFSFVNLEIRNNLQNMLIINNNDISMKTEEYFNELVNNSYRICKPKNVLLREKIFKKFN